MKLNSFKINLARLIKSRNISQTELAEKIGTSRQTINRWINGINEPDIETFNKDMFSSQYGPKLYNRIQ